MSPMRHPPGRPCSLAIVAGSAEPQAWVAQSRDFADLCKQHGHDCLYGELPGDNHYSIMTPLESPSSWLSRLTAGMALAPSNAGQPLKAAGAPLTQRSMDERKRD